MSVRAAVKILGVSGSMGEGASSTQALRWTLDAARARGAETRLIDLRESNLPMFRPGLRPQMAALEDATAAVNWADALVLSTPDYHGSMSGAMKNFLDFHWHEFAGKVFGYVCASSENGTTAMEQMRTAVRQCYGWSLPYGVAIDAEQDFDEALNLINGKTESRLRMMARDLTVYSGLLRDQFRSDLESDEPFTFAARYRLAR